MFNLEAEAMKEYLWGKFGLDKKSINFHLIDMGWLNIYIAPGIINDKEDLMNSEAFAEVTYDYCTDSQLDIIADAYNIGDGESEDADSAECAELQRLWREQPAVMDEFIRQYGEPMPGWDGNVENPECCDREDEDEEDE